ncbi:MAG: AraC family transcriptional regulator [Tannerellaceae bacterium]|jgi:AraC-like DNA-binding protein|nr:AraC family transcriptional regulator [Tannerellaceae bacterium]
MKRIPQYSYFKTKNNKALLIDVVDLHYVKPFVATNDFHTLDYYDLTFIHEGSGFFTINEQTQLVRPNDVVFTKPSEVRNWDNEGIKQGESLLFDGAFIQQLFNDPEFLQHLSFFALKRHSIKLSLSKETIAKVREILFFIRDEISNSDGDLYRMRAYLYELFVLLNREYVNSNSLLTILPEENRALRNRHVNAFMRMVNTEYSNEHCIHYYAAKLDITPNYLNEIVKRNLGINAKQYVQNRLTVEAKRMLAQSNLSVSAIAQTLSFQSASYFVRFFRMQTTYTPLQYRNMVKTIGQFQAAH